MSETDDGDYVLHSDALAAIETARKEERANIVGWLREFTDYHAHTPHDFAQWIESGYHTRAPTGDEND